MPEVNPAPATLPRRLPAEAIGTGLLVTVVVGSGIAAQRLSPGDPGFAVAGEQHRDGVRVGGADPGNRPGVRGAHFNPVVTAADWLLGRRAGTGISGVHVAPYVAAQTFGAVVGALMANAMFDLPVVEISTTDRASTGHGIGEVVATVGLALVIALFPSDPATGDQAVTIHPSTTPATQETR